MQIKVLVATLLAFAITAFAAVPENLDARHYEHKFPCHWYGTGPYCEGYCPYGTFKLTIGKGGCNNGQEIFSLYLLLPSIEWSPFQENLVRRERNSSAAKTTSNRLNVSGITIHIC